MHDRMGIYRQICLTPHECHQELLSSTNYCEENIMAFEKSHNKNKNHSSLPIHENLHLSSQLASWKKHQQSPRMRTVKRSDGCVDERMYAGKYASIPVC